MRRHGARVSVALVPLLMLFLAGSCVRDSAIENRRSLTSTRPGKAGLSWTTGEIKARLAKLPPWPNEFRDFTPEEWLQFVALAHALQQAPPDTVRLAMEQYVEQSLTDETGPRGLPAGFEWSKLYILLRVLFAVPSAPRDGHKNVLGPIGGGFMFGYDAMSEEEYQRLSSLASAPILWTDGVPCLFACLAGYNGGPYDVGYEWSQYRQHYGYRNLDKTLRILQARVAAQTHKASSAEEDLQKEPTLPSSSQPATAPP